MSTPTTEHRSILDLHLAAEAAHDADAAAATYHNDGWYENCALGIRFDGRDLVAFQYAASYGLIANLAARYDWEVDLGDHIVQCGRITGVASGELLGVPLRGGVLDFPFTAVITFRGDKMAGEHIWYDLELFCQQAGADCAAVRAAAAALALHVSDGGPTG